MYVGQTCQSTLSARSQKNGKDYENCTYFYNAIQKYGWNNFEAEIIASNLTHDEADKFEMTLIRELNTMDKNIGYNIAPGGRTNAGGMNLIDMTDKRYGKLKVIERAENDQTKEVYWVCKCDCGNKIVCTGDLLRKGFKTSCGCENNHPKNFDKIIFNKNATGGSNGNAKPVICLNTKEFFECIKDAAKKYGISYHSIGDCCNKRTKSSGKDHNGNKLVWVFKSEYVNMTEKDIDDMFYRANHTLVTNDMVVNIETKELFQTKNLARKKYNIHNSNKIRIVCENKKGTCAGFHWRFYKDYLEENNLTDEEARKSLFFIEKNMQKEDI